MTPKINLRNAIRQNGSKKALTTRYSKISPYYEIDSDGNIYGLNGKLRKPVIKNNGYHALNLAHEDGGYKQYSVHILVALAFHPNPNNYDTVNHKDENKINNKPSNLEWMMSGNNTRYSQSGKPKQKRSEANV